MNKILGLLACVSIVIGTISSMCILYIHRVFMRWEKTINQTIRTNIAML